MRAVLYKCGLILRAVLYKYGLIPKAISYKYGLILMAVLYNYGMIQGHHPVTVLTVKIQCVICFSFISSFSRILVHYPNSVAEEVFEEFLQFEAGQHELDLAEGVPGVSTHQGGEAGATGAD